MFFISGNCMNLTVHVESAGNLINQIDLSKVEEVDSLTISGDLNGTDVLVINKMINLTLLNLSDAQIVSGGQSYHEKYYTEDNVLGSYFFNNLANLEILHMPKVETVKHYALRDNKNLKVLRVSPDIMEVDKWAYPNSIEIVDVPNLMKWCEASHNSSVFANHAELWVDGQKADKLYIPEGTRWISSNAFTGCDTFSEVKIPNSVTYVGEWSFNSSPSQNHPLSKIELGNSIETIKDYAFGECPLLKSLILPASLASVNYKSIIAENLETLIIEDGVNTINIDLSLILKGNGLRYFYMGRNVSITDDGRSGSLGFRIYENEGEVEIGNSVTDISDGLFSWISPKRFKMGESVQTIGEEAFYDSNIGEEIELPNIVKIGKSAFRGSSIKKFIIGNKLREIGEYGLATGDTIQIDVPSINSWISAFNIHNNVDLVHYISPYQLSIGGENVESLIIDEIDEIPSFTFKECCNIIKSVDFKCKIKNIWRGAFAASNVQAIRFEQSIDEIGYEAFANCNQLKEIIICDSIVSIGKEAFKGCSSLSNVELGKCKQIGQQAFDAKCDNFRYLKLPSTLENVGHGAFSININLTDVTIDDSPNKLKLDIENFSDPYYCNYNHSVKKLYLGRDLDLAPFINQRYNKYVFGFKNLKTLTFGYMVKDLDRCKDDYGIYKQTGRASFCVSDSVTCEGVEPPEIDETTFSDTYEHAVLTVPKGCKDIYWLHPYWGKFSNIEEQEFPIKDIVIDSVVQNVPLNEDIQFHATISPAYPNKKIAWKSDDPNIATVSGAGVVHGVTEGITKITASCDNCTYSCKINVVNTSSISEIQSDIPYERVESIYSLDGRKLHLNSLEGLTPGVYIINGRKVLIK